MGEKAITAAVEEGVEAGTTPVSTPTKKPAAPSRKPQKLPPYKVLLHNDDVNTFEQVVAAILKLTGLQAEEAVLRTLQAHETGVALLLVTHKERAELYQDQFSTFQITTTIEPDRL